MLGWSAVRFHRVPARPGRFMLAAGDEVRRRMSVGGASKRLLMSSPADCHRFRRRMEHPGWRLAVVCFNDLRDIPLTVGSDTNAPRQGRQKDHRPKDEGQADSIFLPDIFLPSTSSVLIPLSDGLAMRAHGVKPTGPYRQLVMHPQIH